MSHRLTISEILERHPDEWVFVEDPVTDENLDVLSGIVRLHSKDCDEVEREMLKLRPQRSALLFTGSASDEIVVLP